MRHPANVLLVIACALVLMTGSLLADKRDFFSPAWDEGDNVKLNTDGTSQLQNEESLRINPTDPDNVIAIWRDFRLGYRRVGVGTSFDGGQTWSDSLLVGTPYPRHSDPVLSYDSDGNFYACILSFEYGLNWNGLFIYKSTDGGVSWGSPVAVVDEVLGAFEDKQWINVDRTGGTYDGRVYVPWTRFTDITEIICSRNLNETIFLPPVTVSDTPGVQWPTVTIGSDGMVYVAWWSYSNAGIMIDKSTDGGDMFDVDQQLTSSMFFPSEINGGIFTFSFPALEADISGGIYDNTLYIVYADLAEDDNLDIFVIKSTDNAASWSAPVRINDDPIGNNIDQFHPWIDINEDGIVTAVWLDRRLDPANLNYDCYSSHSFDGGVTWTANRRLSEVSSSPFDAKLRINQDFYTNLKLPGRPEGSPYRPGRDPQAGLIGEYIGLSTVGDRTNVVWTDTRDGNQDVYGTRVTTGFAAPPLYAPEDETTTSENQPHFTWGKSGPTPAELANFPATVVQPLYYVIEVDDDPLFGSVDYFDSALTVTDHQFTAPLSDGDWYWRVSAVNDSARATGYDEPYRAFTIDTDVPILPTLLNPTPDSLLAFESQTFEWTAVTKHTQSAVSYQLQVSTDITFTTTEIDETALSTNSYQNLSGLTPNETYYWRVRPYDEADNSPGFTAQSRFFTEREFICGDADGNEIVEVSDAVMIINYVFVPGSPAPDPIESADVDCNEIAEISDAVYLISYVFVPGSPVPCADCP